MDIPSFAELLPSIQTAIGPVILISGVGMMLLTMTNRLGRVIDRSRLILRELHSGVAIEPAHLRAELKILWRRARLIRLCIAFAGGSALLAAVLIITLFVTILLRVDAVLLLVILFSGCLLSLIASLVGFLYDINLSLSALKVEMKLDLPDEELTNIEQPLD